MEGTLYKIDREEIPLDYRRPVKAPILKTYKYSKGPHRVKLAIEPYDRGQLVDAVVEMTEIGTQINVLNDDEVQSRTDVLYEVKNSRLQFLTLAMPEGVTAWSVYARSRDRSGRPKAVRVPASREGNFLKIPLERRPDPDRPTITTNSPCLISSSTPRSTGTSKAPIRKLFSKPLV